MSMRIPWTLTPRPPHEDVEDDGEDEDLDDDEDE